MLEEKRMKSTILIVDDEPSARTTLEAILVGEGYNLEMAETGQDALGKAASLTPDLILLDAMMPGMNGFDVCRKLRSTPGLAEVPIVILTALEDHFFLLAGIEAGADDFLTKPVDRQELIARVRTITRLNRYHTLLDQRENLRQMAGRLVSAQEEERRRISRELHDELGQALTAHNLNLHNLTGDLPSERPEMRNHIDLLISETNDMLNRVRHLAQNLRPPALDTLGLPLAITTYCQEFEKRTGIPVLLQIDLSLPMIQDVYAVTLYRILQESLTNIIKHADANHVWVNLEQEENKLSLTIQDNGHGFDVENVQSNGIGIAGIRERLELVGGQLVVRTGPGRGVVVSAYLNLEPQMLVGKEAK
jgi:two-component system, sensor histidine kinase and response regulator